MKKRIGIIGVSVFLVIFWGCDNTPLTSSDEIITQTFRSIPGSELEQTVSSLSGSASRYTCSVTTLNEPGSENKYSHHNAIHFFPDDESVARSDGKKVTWSFVVTDEARSRPENTWSHDGYDNVVRTAICDLPDVEGIEEEMARRLSGFDSDRKQTFVQHSGNLQVHTARQKGDERLAGPELQPMGLCGGGHFCTTYGITTFTIKGVIVSVYVECVAEGWSYFSGCNSYGGEGVNEPPELGECDGCPNDPCQFVWAAPPWMCGNSPFDIIIDPSFSNNPCLSSVFSNVGNKPTINGYLNNFDGTFSIAHLRLAGNSSLPNNIAARTYPPEDWVVKIDFNTNRLNRPPLDVARTFIHELIHAEIFRKLLMLSENSEIVWSMNFIESMKDDFPGLYDYYMRWHVNAPDGVPPGSTQHQMMAQHYRGVIKQVLEEFDDSHDDEVYEALAWVGLRNTVAWNNLSAQEKSQHQTISDDFIQNNPPCQ